MTACNENHVCVIGCGNVTQYRIAPALRQLAAEGLIDSISFADVLEVCPLGLVGKKCDERYIQVSHSEGLPPSVLRDLRRFPAALVVIACPTPSHGFYIEQLEPGARRIACEKPLALNIGRAQAMWSYGRALFCVDHYLWKAEILRIVRHIRDGTIDLSELDRIDFDLMESIGTEGREIENAVFDLGWHGFSCAQALMDAAQIESRCVVKRSMVSTYQSQDGKLTPTTFTAARIEAAIELTGGRTVDFIARVGKGLAQKRKQITLSFRSGYDRHCVALDEPDPTAAHRRLLRNLLTRRYPNFLSARANIGIVGACRRACDLAIDLGYYPFGNMALFLEKSDGYIASENYY